MVRMVCSRWVQVRFREMLFVSAMVSSWKLRHRLCASTFNCCQALLAA